MRRPGRQRCCANCSTTVRSTRKNVATSSSVRTSCCSETSEAGAGPTSATTLSASMTHPSPTAGEAGIDSHSLRAMRRRVVSAEEAWNEAIDIADLQHLTDCEQFRLGESLAGQFERVLCSPWALLRLNDKDD